MTQNWEWWLIHQRVVCCPEGPQQAGEKEWQEPHAAQQGEAPSCAHGDEQPQAPVNAGATQLESSKKRTWGSWWTSSWTRARNEFLCQRTVMVSWAALRGALSASCGRLFLPSTQDWWGHTWRSLSSSGLLSKRDTWIYHLELNKISQRRDCRNSLIRKDWEAWDCLGWGREGTQYMDIWKESVKKTEPNCFQ